MSIKHFNDYYNDLYKNYIEMINGLQELENACSTGMVPPETVEQYMKTLQPIKDSFLTVQYIRYLLNKPNKKSKQARYESMTSNIDKNKFKDSINDNAMLLKDLHEHE